MLGERWLPRVNAVLQSFYAGMEGGTALARLLFGEVVPSGKLPFTVARASEDYPHFDKNADRIDYGYWHGYQRFAHHGVEPRFAFGHGLSYTRFSYRALTVARAADGLSISVAVRNDGDVAAEEIVQAYVGFPGGIEPRPEMALRGFARVTLAPGETRIVRLSVSIETLRYRDPVTHGWRLEPGEHRVLVGGSSRVAELLGARVML